MTNIIEISNKYNEMIERNYESGLVIIPFNALLETTYIDIENSNTIRITLNMGGEQTSFKIDMDTFINDTIAIDIEVQLSIDLMVSKLNNVNK